MEDIPFIVWTNHQYDSVNKHLVFDIKRSFNTRDFIHAAQDFTGIYCELYDSTKSLFSPYYEINK